MAADQRLVYIEARLAAHNSRHSPHTAKDRPWKRLVVIAFDEQEPAIRFEKYLKTGSAHPSFGAKRDHRVDSSGATGGDEAGDQGDSGHDQRSAEQRSDRQRRDIEENALHRSSGKPRAEHAKRTARREKAQA